MQESGEKGTVGRRADLRTFVESFLYDQLESKKLHNGQWQEIKKPLETLEILQGREKKK